MRRLRHELDYGLSKGRTTTPTVDSRDPSGRPRVDRRKRLVSVLGFLSVPLLSLVTITVAVPLVARKTGEAGVVAISVGQSVGFAFAVAISLSWPLVGPARIALAAGGERIELYRRSMSSRTVVFAATAIPCAAISSAVVADYKTEAALTAIAFAGTGFTSTWYFSGIGSPRGLILHEALPRTIATVATGALLYVGAPLICYPATQLVATLYTFLILMIKILGGIRGELQWKGTLVDLRGQMGATSSRIINGLYMGGGITLVALISPLSALLFAGLDRVQKAAYGAGNSFPIALVSWVAAGKEHMRQRQLAALLVDIAFCSIAASAFGLVLEPVSEYVYANLIRPSLLAVVLTSISLGLALLNRCLQAHLTLPSGLEKLTTTILSVGSTGGIILIAGGALALGALGALGGIVVAELVMCGALGIAWFRCAQDADGGAHV